MLIKACIHTRLSTRRPRRRQYSWTTTGQVGSVRYLRGRSLVERSVRRGQSLPRAPLRRGPRRTPRSTLAPETWPARPVPRVRARPRRRPSRIPRRLSVTPVHITLFAPRSRSRRGPRPADPAARRRSSARSLCRADPLVLGRTALKRSAARCCGFCSTRCSYSPRLPLRVPRHGLR